MNNLEEVSKHPSKGYRWVIVVLSIAIPVVVSLLFYVPQTGNLGSTDVSFLPHLNAVLNSGTAISLLAGFIFIKSKNIKYHRLAMLTAFTLSSIFLVSYVVYHYQGAHTLYGDINHNGIVEPKEKSLITNIRYVYYFILLTHIVLAAIVVPLVLFAIYYALANQILKHKKLVRFTFPIWLYVALTGVIVYMMIKPYYIG